MIRYLLLIVLCPLAFGLSILPASAQPVLVRDSLVRAGYSQLLKRATMLRVDTTQQGAGQEWDFSSLEAGTDSQQLVYTSVAASPYSHDFLTANYCYATIVPGRTTYQYFTLDDSSCVLIGKRSDLDTSADRYTDPRTELVFPLGLGTTNEDTWVSSGSSFSGSSSLICLGTGTLRLPGGIVFSNAFMVRRYIDDVNPVLSYTWYGSNGAVLLRYRTGDPLFSPEQVWFITQWNFVEPTGLPRVAADFGLRYNNPVQDELLLNGNISSALSYQLCDVLGRSYAQGVISGAGPHSLGMQGLQPGMYYLRLSRNGTAQTLKLLKQ